MRKLEQYEIHCHALSENEFFLYAFKNGREAEPEMWADLLFQWHRGTVYGTELQELTLPLQMGKWKVNVRGVVIDALSVLELFGTEPFHSFVEWEFDEFSQTLFGLSPVIYESIQSGRWKPDFASGPEGGFSWKVPEDVWEEFLPDFWESPVEQAAFMRLNADEPKRKDSIGPDAADREKGSFGTEAGDEKQDSLGLDAGNQKQDSLGSDAADEMRDRRPVVTMKDLAGVLFGRGVEDFLKRQPGFDDIWEEKMAVFRDPKWHNLKLSSFFDEDRFLKWIGLAEDGAPFSIGMRLAEPQEDGDMWQLAMILTDRKDPQKTIPLKDILRKKRRVGKKWRDHLEEVLKEERRIGRFYPWLVKEEFLDVVSGESDHLVTASGEWNRAADEKAAGNLISQADEAGVLNGSKAAFLNKTGANLSKPPASDNEPAKMARAAEESVDLPADTLLKEELSEDEAWEFLTNASEVLLTLGIDILLPSWWEALKKTSPQLTARVKGTSAGPSFVGLDALMDFEWRFAMNGVQLSEEEFRRLVDEKRRLIRVNGRWIKLDPDFIKRMQRMMEKAEKEGLRVQDIIERELLQADGAGETETEPEENDERVFAKIQIELQPKLQGFVRNLADMAEIPELPVPESFSGKLRPYQEKGMNWLYFLRRYRFGACLADDMGLGKTIQLIAYLLLVKENEPGAGPALIICPTSVLGNWQRELERFSPGLKVYLHYGAQRNKGEGFRFSVSGDKAKQPDVVLTTYGLSHLDFDELSGIRWGTIVLDEAQNIKNPGTKQSRSIRKLKGTHHIALTGTPMENRLTELWSIFDFINKGYLGSLARFHKRFVLPIERENDREKIGEIRNLIRPFLLRRTKKDEEVALNLPDKLEQKEYCALTVEQAALYEQLVKDTFEEIAQLTGFERRGYVLRLLGRLKQLCNHPALYLKEETPAATDDLIARSLKMEKLAELMDQVLEQDESALIFTQYIGMGKMIQRVLEEKYGMKVPFLSGSTPKAKRDEMISRFQNGGFPIFLLSLKAGGTGLNLTAANHVIHYDRWWNPAVENQATDRAYRIGQTKFVHVHKFITTGTLEEKIDRMLEKKQALNDEIIQSDQWIADMDDEELYEILRLE